ncbi:MAG TPA: hypothetical protein VLK65_06745 [Vicinamibacteria bacterium]|nr:hypothetical protein [Vicinamibacteria bacterium]
MRDGFGELVYTPDFGDVSNLNSARNPAFARLDDGIPRIEEDFLRSVPWLPTFGLRFRF